MAAPGDSTLGPGGALPVHLHHGGLEHLRIDWGLPSASFARRRNRPAAPQGGHTRKSKAALGAAKAEY